MKRRKSRESKTKGSWVVTFDDGTRIDMGYYPYPRMAVAAALRQHKGKVKDVKYHS